MAGNPSGFWGKSESEPAFERLDDGDVKLVAYFIVSLRRGHERVLPKALDTIVVTDNLSTEAFTSFLIAAYLQTEKGMATPQEDHKYLRVHFNVVRRGRREPLEF